MEILYPLTGDSSDGNRNAKEKWTYVVILISDKTDFSKKMC